MVSVDLIIGIVSVCQRDNTTRTFSIREKRRRPVSRWRQRRDPGDHSEEARDILQRTVQQDLRECFSYESYSFSAGQLLVTCNGITSLSYKINVTNLLQLLRKKCGIKLQLQRRLHLNIFTHTKSLLIYFPNCTDCSKIWDTKVSGDYKKKIFFFFIFFFLLLNQH